MPPIGDTAADYFGPMAASYDSLIRRAIPRYDEMTDRLVEYLPPFPNQAPRILELGCGTGNLTLRLAARYPTSHITTVDAAPEMTSLTAARVARAGATLRTITATFESLDLPAAGFELVASCMSLHHVMDKAALARSIHRWLAPGGWLCYADELLGAAAHIQDLHWQQWLAHCRKPGGCSPEEVKGLLDHATAHDHYTPLTEQFDQLRAAGFTTIDCVWRDRMYSVVTAAR